MSHRAAPTMPADKKARPVQVSFFGLQAIVKKTNALAQLVKQSGGLENRDGDFARIAMLYLHTVCWRNLMTTNSFLNLVRHIIRQAVMLFGSFAGYIKVSRKQIA